MFTKLRYGLINIFNIRKLHTTGVVFDKNNLKLYGKLDVFRGVGVMEIGKNVTIRSGFEYTVLGGYPRTRLYVENGGRLFIGDNSGISSSVIYASADVHIGASVLIGAGCLITDSDHHSIDYYSRCGTEPDMSIVSKPVYISDGVFIGANCIILKGVKIGEKSVIGAGSVVTKDVPDGEIWAGNPALFIRKI